MDKSATTVSPSTISEGIPTAQRRRRRILSRVFLPVVAKKEMETGSVFTLQTQIPLLQSITRSSIFVNTLSVNALIGRDSSTLRMGLRSIPLQEESSLTMT